MFYFVAILLLNCLRHLIVAVSPKQSLSTRQKILAILANDNYSYKL